MRDSFLAILQSARRNRSQAAAAAAQEFEARTLLLQSQLEYVQAQDELTQAIGLTPQ
jgi:hypothetical protein